MQSPLRAEDYARFLTLQGYHVRRNGDVFWFEASRWFLLSAPHHREYEVTREELQGLFRGFGCAGVRFAAPLNCEWGRLSYQIVLDRHDYGLEQLSSNVRSKVRRGLKRCEVRPTDFATLEEHGWALHVETLERQNRGGSWSRERWRRFWDACRKTPGIEGWGAWVGDQLVAFLVTVTFDDAVEFLLSRSTTGERGAYPNNALVFRVAEEMLVHRGVPQITFGLESLEPVQPLDEFKFSMGFYPRPIRQVVVFHPLLRLLLSQPRARALVRQWAARRGRHAVFWRKAAGLLRFSEESSP
ncbi:MAG: GNAT family N-acetyltransferase [Candidatus Binatia bacterium]|nr:GNAT family N-acetyltransferase [Candidatus Binatia bacterium]